MRVVPLIRVAWLLPWVLLSIAEAQAAPSPPPLFDTRATAVAASWGASSRATVRQRTVTSRLGLLVGPDGSQVLGAGHKIQLNLFDDARFSMTVTDVNRYGGTSLAWSGVLDGVDMGSAVLAVDDGVLVGHVSMPGAVYRIGLAPNGAASIEEVDQAAFPREGDAIVPPGLGVAALQAPGVGADSASQIDVMVLYTAAARTAATATATSAAGTAAMRAQVALAVAASNQAYANNGLVQRLRLVYAGEVAMTESASFSADLTALQADPTVGWLRDVTRADLVSLLVEHGPSAAVCGIGFVMRTNSTSFAPVAFNVVERDCASSNLSLPHEFGHNMGAHHDVFVIGTDHGLFTYSHGWVDLIGKFRTVMAYPDQCAAQRPPFNCTRVPFFSTPDLTLNGRPLGNSVTADNARTLSESADTVTNFRQALTSPLTVTTAVNLPTIGVGQTLVGSVGVNYPGGLTGTPDFYVGLLAPNGVAAFFTDVSITPSSGYAMGTIADLATYRPIARGVPLDAPFSVNLPTFLSYPRQAGDPTGGLALFVLVVRSGPLTDTTFTSDQLIAASVVPFTFPATSPGDAGP